MNKAAQDAKAKIFSYLSVRGHAENIQDIWLSQQPCRIEAKVWRDILLENEDYVTMHGKVHRLTGRSIGFGLVQISYTTPIS